jgi:DNA-binding NtrC family response regulator
MLEKRILIVEDMRDWRDQLENTLRRGGYQVTTVPSYGEALGELRRQPYQIAIVDLRLSLTDQNNLDGMKLLSDLSAMQIPAIVLTGFGTPELVRQAYDELAVFDFVDKQNLDLKRFREIIKDAFRKIEGREKELSELRARFLRGEVINYPEKPLGWSLREGAGSYEEESESKGS